MVEKTILVLVLGIDFEKVETWVAAVFADKTVASTRVSSVRVLKILGYPVDSVCCFLLGCTEELWRDSLVS